jgi:hypothetical protein
MDGKGPAQFFGQNAQESVQTEEGFIRMRTQGAPADFSGMSAAFFWCRLLLAIPNMKV